MAAAYHLQGVSGWYAPGMEIHRSPFSGRNFEYYSEDGGLYAYIKHYALNDQETDRGNYLTTWSNEQAIREIYLKPFEITVKDGEVIAVMSSYNYIGTKWFGNQLARLAIGFVACGGCWFWISGNVARSVS